MIDQSTIDRIIDAANIVDVVSEYVTLRRAGASYKGLCPFHDDKTPSFYVSPAKGLCKCFSCGKGGNSVHFIMEQEQLTYYEALKFLAKKYGIEVKERELTDEQKQSQSERESMFAVNEWASNYFHQTMLNHQDGRAVGLAYFRSRGFRDDIIERFRLGFCLSQNDAMAKEAKKKGYKEEYLVKTGLCYRRDDGTLRDKYWGRVMFPWFSVSGKVTAFGGRVLDARTKGVSQKYINSPESEIFHKSNELYGIFQAKKAIVKEDRVYMVEGYTDVISMHQCGVENVVANSGTALNEAQIRLLHRFTSNITLLYDGDSAGIHAALRGTDMLLAEGMNVKILLLPDGDDPDSFARKHNATEFRQYVEANQTDFIIFKTNLLLGDAGRDPLKRAQLIKDIVKSISVIPEEIVRSTYLHECSELLGADEAMLIRETNKNRKAELERIQKEKERERERQKLKENNPQQRESDFAHTNDGLVPPPPPAPEDVPPYDPDSIPPADTDIPLPIDAGEIPPPQEPIDRPPFGEESHIFATKTSKDEARFIGLERLIMTIVARHGEQPITVQDAEGNNIQISIAQYVESELTNDGLQFRSPLYALMLNETAAHSADPGFVASRYLLNNPSLDISREAANLLSEQYHLSKSEDKKDDEADDEANEAKRAEEEMQRTLITATNTISRLLLDYKYTFIENELRTVSKLLTDPSVINNPERCNEVMQQYITLSNIQRELAKHLGDRVFVK